MQLLDNKYRYIPKVDVTEVTFQHFRHEPPKLGSLFRYVDNRYAASLDEWDEPVGKGSCGLTCWEYEIVKRTPKGVWIECHGEHKFVLQTARKQFALPTKELALDSFLARKRSQYDIHMARADNAAEAYAMAQQVKQRLTNETSNDLY